MKRKPDKSLQYMLGGDYDYEDWIWRDGGLKEYLGPAPYWVRFEGCAPDCCGEIWEVEHMTEEEFEEYLNSFPEEEVMSL